MDYLTKINSIATIVDLLIRLMGFSCKSKTPKAPHKPSNIIVSIVRMEEGRNLPGCSGKRRN